MSNWDWIHAGLETATYLQVLKTQRSLAEINTREQEKAARQALLDAMTSYIFDISRQIQIVEEHVSSFPQQVYVVARSLELRFKMSGLSADTFQGFQNMQYVFDTQKKIYDVIKKTKAMLTPEKIEQSELAVKYIYEMPMLQQAITGRSLQNSLTETEKKWKNLVKRNNRKALYIFLGMLGSFGSMTIGGLVFIYSISTIPISLEKLVVLVAVLPIMAVFFIGSFAVFIYGLKSNSEFVTLRDNRSYWTSKLPSGNDWHLIVSSFGTLTYAQFDQMYNERLAYIKQYLDGDFNMFPNLRD